MATLSSNTRATLTARSGAARSGAIRSGFCPTKTDKGAYPATTGNPYYIWRALPLPTTTWTHVA